MDRNVLLIDAWKTSLRASGRSPRTVRAYTIHVASFLSQYSEIDLLSIESFVGANLDTMAPKTVALQIAAIKQFLKWSMDRELVGSINLSLLPKVRINEKSIEPLTRGECRQIIQAVKGRRLIDLRNEAMITLMIDTAARLNETLDILVGDLDFDNRRLKIRNGKGGRGRVVPLSFQSVSVLQLWLLKRPLEGGYVFTPTPFKVSKKLSDVGIRNLVSRYSERAGIERRVYPHLLRVTSLCLMTEYLTPWQLMDIAGHSNINQTMHYVRLAKRSKQVPNKSPLDFI